MANEGWLRILVCLSIGVGVSCGSDDEGSTSPSNPSSTATSSGAPPVFQSESGTSRQATSATCDDACGRAVALCGDTLGSLDDCMSVCGEIPPSTLSCMAGASVCDDVMACAEPGSTAQSDAADLEASGELGAECFSDADCGSAFCRTPPGADAGQCVQNDFGEPCASSDDCAHGLCLFRTDTSDTSGICSATCESFVDCPTFWECTQLSNGAATVCWNG